VLIIAMLVAALQAGIVTRDGPQQGDVRPNAAAHCEAPPVMTSVTSAVRSGDSWLTGLIDQGLSRSGTFARLAAAVAADRGMVYIEWRLAMRDGLAGALHHHVFQGADGTRYLRVFVLHGRSPSAVIETIAHELQHVVEFLESGSDDFAAFSSRRPDLLDRRADLTVYETAAAKRTAAAVRRELAKCDGK
jgi:hypothetical protein